MNDSEKPFACTEPGCGMSFMNEDHLTVHIKKHDMMLNLGINNKSNFFIADQTPTPTRFIRSCEEVGLFQDLHHDNDNDNPFEETFRRAVEAGKSGTISVPEVEESDTLHTPNIYPHPTEECTDITVSTKNQDVKSNSTNFKESATLRETVSSKEIQIESSKEVPQKNQSNISSVINKNVVVQAMSSSPSIVNCIGKSGQLPTSNAEMQLLLKTQDGKVLKLIAAPIVKVHSNNSALTQVVKQKTDKVSTVTSQTHDKPDVKKVQGASVKMKLKQVLAKNGATLLDNKKAPSIQNVNKPKEPSKDKSKKSTLNVMKQALLERNRASSMRARAKKKAWIEQLQQSLVAAHDINSNLQNQVKVLHAQVERLKTLLLAHKDCPVTKAMGKGNGIVIGSKVMTIRPNGVEPVKRSSTEKSAGPKKKVMILPATKSPIILPKMLPNQVSNTITLHGVDAIKTIPTVSISAIHHAGEKKIFIRPENSPRSVLPEEVEFRIIENSQQKNASSEASSTVCLDSD